MSLDQVGRFVGGEEDLPAIPILDRLGVPAAFYVTVDCVENRRLPWPSRLRYSFLKTPRKEWKDEAAKVWNLGSDREREAAYLAACDRVAMLAGAAQERVVSHIEFDLGTMLPAESGDLMMSWDQVCGMAQRGHIVGSHTMTHPNLAHVGVEDARRELVESKRRMEAHINAKVVHFSYPCPALFPNWNEQTTEESERAGYETAVTTSSGLARRNDNPLALKRVRPSKTVDGLRWNLETAFAGRAI